MHPYQHSGNVPFTGRILCILAAIATGILVGVVNACANHWVKLQIALVVCVPVPVPFVVTAFLGMMGGFMLKASFWFGRSRNLSFNRGMTLLSIVLAVWVYWSVSQWTSNFAQPSWRAFLPSSIGDYAAHQLKNGQILNGWQLAVGWVFEFLAFAACAYFVAMAENDQPYCEQCGWWTKTESGPIFFAGKQNPEAWAKFAAGDVSALLSIPILDKKSLDYARLDVASCATCQQTHYLIVKSVTPPLLHGRAPLVVTMIPFQQVSTEELQMIRNLANPPAEAV